MQQGLEKGIAQKEQQETQEVLRAEDIADATRQLRLIIDTA